ncbi:MAG: allophanate hydrolase subunit 1 [Planctomycetaceae bacterium]|nr:allophanate hydrolase subunit 1 [Planctomycetaceae bacterium]
MKLKPLGDQAVLAYCADEAAAVRFAAAVRTANPPWLQDVVPAYGSVGVFFDADQIGTTDVTAWLLASNENLGGLTPLRSPQSVVIPVCYEFAPDMPRVCEQTGLTSDEVIRLHTTTEFTIYAIGFVPGFPYMGYLPEKLCGVGRLPSPRVRVDPGSVGLTGRQTGIYPLPRPGGWNLIGRTPLVIVDVAAGFFPLRVGDVVRFDRIDSAQFRELEGERLIVASRASHCTGVSQEPVP